VYHPLTGRVVLVRIARNVLFTSNITSYSSSQAISFDRSLGQTRCATETEWYKRTYCTIDGRAEFPELHSHWSSWSWRNGPYRVMASSLSRLHEHNHTTLGRTPLDEWSAEHRDNHLTTRNTTDNHAPAGIQTRNPSKRATTTHLLDGVATAIGTAGHYTDEDTEVWLCTGINTDFCFNS
jgi:hypothetical protein